MWIEGIQQTLRDISDDETLHAAVPHVLAYLETKPEFTITQKKALNAAQLMALQVCVVLQLGEVLALQHAVQEAELLAEAKDKFATKLAKTQTEGLRRLMLAMASDLRVVLLVLAYRLESLRQCVVDNVTPQQRYVASYAADTLKIYAPLANRLGVSSLKWELEDLAFRFSDPVQYKAIAKALEAKRVERTALIEAVTMRLQRELKALNIAAKVYGRPKHIYSIANKMRSKGLSMAGLYDLRAVRVVVQDARACYSVLGVVHDVWKPIPKEFDDYIARPKSNGYQSLHTVVVADDGKPIEIQIRTTEMHEFAEYGVAAHWRYKERSAAPSNTAGDATGIAWVRRLLAWQQDFNVKSNDSAWLQADERVYALTPQGRVIELPAGATAIDFAYYLHTDLGHRCRGAKLDGVMVPLITPVRTGQTVEIITDKKQGAGPSRDWLNPNLGYTASPRSRAKVRAWFNAQDIAQQAELAESKSTPKLEEITKPPERTAEELDAITLERIQWAGNRSASQPKTSHKSDVLVVGLDMLLTQLAGCCKPAPPDAIGGYVTRGKGVSIHRLRCASFLHLTGREPQRVIECAWGSQDENALKLPQRRAFACDVRVSAADRQGLLRDISDAFAMQKISVTAVNSQSVRGEARMTFTVRVNDTAQLAKAISVVADVKGVVRVNRK